MPALGARPHQALRAFALALALAGTTIPAAHAQPVNGPGFAAVWQALDKPRLAGTGRVTYFKLRIYDAWLWVGPEGLDPERMATPFVLELRYARSADGRALAQRNSAEIARLGLGTASQRTAWQLWMAGNIPNLKSGGKLTGVYRPGDGMSLLHDGRPIASTDDDLFARAFFSIWLDARTSKPELRAELLRNLGHP